MPAHIKSWCRRSADSPRVFVKHYNKVVATIATTKLLWIAVPIEDYGKGYLFSINQPEIHCDAETCMFHPATNVYMKTTLDASQVALVNQVVFTFHVDGMFVMRQWWSPRLAEIKATLLDSHGKQLGEGTVLAKLTSS
jgi:hypothetical protein